MQKEKRWIREEGADVAGAEAERVTEKGPSKEGRWASKLGGFRQTQFIVMGPILTK